MQKRPGKFCPGVFVSNRERFECLLKNILFDEQQIGISCMFVAFKKNVNLFS